ncbi:MAG: orotidine 5'-phosphate decarboxylase [Thermoproteales archaeon]|nr:orotidine 5'-phosphate decarboxylase [Thermoproteales archaeon]
MKNYLRKIADEKRSRLILALDFLRETGKAAPFLIYSRCRHLLDDLSELAVGVKIGFPLLFSIGLEGLRNIIEEYRRDFYFIADFKLSDIPYVVDHTLGEIRNLGFNGAIIQLFPTGYGGVVEKHRNEGLGVYGVVLMSHKGGRLFENNFLVLLEYARGLKLDGVIIGATRGEYISKARRILGEDVLIISPGVGVQGARESSALASGADFEIVGRSITLSVKPKEQAKKIVEAQRKVMEL